MARDFEDSGTPAHPTPIPRQRHYPVEPSEARAVAIRRISYRDPRKPAPLPSEYTIWCEFIQFPEVLGNYVPPAGQAGTPRGFAESWIAQREADDQRIYGTVRSQTREACDELLLRLDPLRPLRFAAERGPVLSVAERLAIWRAELARAEREQAGPKRLGFLRRGIERLQARGGDAEALAEIFD